MEGKNNLISVFQFVILGTFIGTSMYEGVASVFLFFYIKHDALIATIIALIIGFIPLFLILKIINYEPTKNIVDKINTLFNKKIAFILNLLLAIYVLVLFGIISWTIINFTALKYLTETPQTFIALLFIVPAFYMAYKGVSTICRSSEILFYIIIVFHMVVTNALSKYVDIENLKPMLSNGIIPPIRQGIHLLSYSVFPFIILTIIPKVNIKNNKKLTKYMIYSYLFTLFSLVLVTFMIESIIGADLAATYRFPAYYVHKKIMLAGVIENVENFTATHWLFSMFITTCICFHYLTEYCNQLFNIKNKNLKLLPFIIISLFIIYVPDLLFHNVTKGLRFINEEFFSIFTITLILIIIIVNISIYLKKRQEIK